MANRFLQRDINICVSTASKTSSPKLADFLRNVPESFEVVWDAQGQWGESEIAAGVTKVIDLSPVVTGTWLYVESDVPVELQINAGPEVITISPPSVPTGQTARKARFPGVDLDFTSLSIRVPGGAAGQVAAFWGGLKS